MDGQTLASGAVAALQGHQDAIDLARVVMDELPHVLVVGHGASRLAVETGFSPQDLLTREAEAIWGAPFTEAGTEHTYRLKMRELAGRLSQDPERPQDAHGTVNVIARDRAGNLASGVSTSGWAWKFPGRVGDSPIIGAGNYADNRLGAATCTGRGEMAQRCCTAHSVVAFMRCGMSLTEALSLAAEDLHLLEDPYRSEVNIIGVDRAGRHEAVSTAAGKTYIVMTEESDDIIEVARRHVSPPSKPRFRA
jgi:beta-aspartyl-peptidase (threonine type)